MIRLPALAVAALVASAGITAAPAGASGDEVALNGTFTAFSDGLWAKTNEIMAYQADVTSRWTLTSSCTTYQDCTGIITSDQGWSADLVYQSQRWRAVRVIPDWQRCPDGSTAPGEQSFTFWAARLDAPDRQDRLTGFDETTGPSGACGVNRWLNVRMPFTLTRADRPAR
jgi:hypothetical protein